eukprot:TRINITY_DN4263_c0_g1_i1.p1 TRINITY_DN4263_c0_g1~~TRINITY_DN4263_c0_g1_i1.p1  ORF type:complete len:398 (-),score=70.60 TRINITY_DN4263_c0_g1_i1:48-1241(-)
MVVLLLLSHILCSYSLDNGLGLYPPMGWNTWCTLGKCGRDFCNETEVLSVAQELIDNGMSSLGYDYVNLDDCWADSRDANGNILADPDRFPSGMKSLIDKIHGMGLKFGLYTCAGTYTCSSGGRDHKIPGSYGHYEQDAKTYASWGVDFVKVDWCSTTGLDPQTQYSQFSHALNVSGRAIFFEMCEWGVNDPWKWGAPLANQWRTTGDHHDDWNNTLGVINKQAGLSSFSGIGAWNYLDFIYTGGQGCTDDPNKHCPGQSDIEYMSEFSFWAFLNSGLIVATDIRIMTPIMKEVLYNQEIIAINKDPLRKQGDRVYLDGDKQVWSRPLADGSVAVILFNSGESEQSITADFSLWGWAHTKAMVRDLWLHHNIGEYSNQYTSIIPPHGVNFVKLHKLP